MLIPTESCQLAPAAEVLFNDMGGDSTCPPAGFQFAHPQVSLSLAYDLSIRRLSEEELSQAGDDIESFHMGEDLTVRIRGVLQDYDIDHSSNEWVANADDAGASSVTFLVDEATFEGRRIIPVLKDFQSGPALVVHNDGVFIEDDFTGLSNIGQGGKSGRADSIGRFGLGALSFYHFSDVRMAPAHLHFYFFLSLTASALQLPWVISGGFCLFLDPSQKYLGRDRANMKRVAARVPLSTCVA